jgi:hypothetical protein
MLKKLWVSCNEWSEKRILKPYNPSQEGFAYEKNLMEVIAKQKKTP